MPCYHPVTAWQVGLTQNGKMKLQFKKPHVKDLHRFESIKLPCGKCIGCKTDKSRQWAIRCMHEASLYENNSFITLTYNAEHLPEDGSINKTVLQKFFKRLRKRHPDKIIRYFACGEYGEKRTRPHYHALIFNYDFPDKKLWSKTSSGSLIFRSKELEEIWTDPKTKESLGYSSIGEVNFQSAAYVARYAFKKLKQGDKEYKKGKYQLVNLDPDTGEILKESDLEEEFCIMSRNKGIGHEWYKKYAKDTEKDFITVDKMKVPVPKYYDYLLDMEHPDELAERKEKRKEVMEKQASEFTKERLKAKEKVKISQINQLYRGYENG